MIQDWRYYEQYLSEPGKQAILTWKEGVDISGILPKVTLTPEEQKIISKNMVQISTYVNELYTKMVIGTKSIDDLPKFRAVLEDMGIDEVLSIYQKAYQRYQAR